MMKLQIKHWTIVTTQKLINDINLIELLIKKTLKFIEYSFFDFILENTRTNN